MCCVPDAAMCHFERSKEIYVGGGYKHCRSYFAKPTGERFIVARLTRNDNDCKYPRDWPHTHEQEGFPDTLPSLLPSFKGITFFPDSAGSAPETLDTAGFLKIAKDLSDHVPTSARAGGLQPAQREGA